MEAQQQAEIGDPRRRGEAAALQRHRIGRETIDGWIRRKGGQRKSFYSAGRIVNVSSDFGLLRLINNEELRQELNDVEKLTEERLDEVLAAYLRDFDAGEVGARGWPMDFSAYKVAKVAMNAYTRILARSHPGLRVNCAHPGYVSTDMTVHTGPLTPEQGAANVVKVALLPEGGPTGAYFALGEEASFV